MSDICWVLWTYLSDSIYVYSWKYIHQYRKQNNNNNNNKYTTTLEEGEGEKEGKRGVGGCGEMGVFVGVLHWLKQNLFHI